MHKYTYIIKYETIMPISEVLELINKNKSLDRNKQIPKHLNMDLMSLLKGSYILHQIK